MPRFIPYDPKQSKLVAICYADQLQPGTFEFAINHLVDHKLDLSIFHLRYDNDDGGRPAYDPAILLKIILFAYAKGITSTREIQWCCEAWTPPGQASAFSLSSGYRLRLYSRPVVESLKTLAMMMVRVE